MIRRRIKWNDEPVLEAPSKLLLPKPKGTATREDRLLRGVNAGEVWACSWSSDPCWCGAHPKTATMVPKGWRTRALRTYFQRNTGPWPKETAQFMKDARREKPARARTTSRATVMARMEREADTLFSRIVKAEAAYRCRRCLKHVTELPLSVPLDCAHIFSRRYHGLRWNEDNAFALCRTCHTILGDVSLSKITAMEVFATRVLGIDVIDTLSVLARTPVKKSVCLMGAIEQLRMKAERMGVRYAVEA